VGLPVKGREPPWSSALDLPLCAAEAGDEGGGRREEKPPAGRKFLL